MICFVECSVLARCCIDTILDITVDAAYAGLAAAMYGMFLPVVWARTPGAFRLSLDMRPLIFLNGSAISLTLILSDSYCLS